jgi:hypothetical protein
LGGPSDSEKKAVSMVALSAVESAVEMDTSQVAWKVAPKVE